MVRSRWLRPEDPGELFVGHQRGGVYGECGYGRGGGTPTTVGLNQTVVVTLTDTVTGAAISPGFSVTVGDAAQTISFPNALRHEDPRKELIGNCAAIH